MVKKICNILSTIIIVLLACVAALLIVPKILGMQAMAVLTGSMEPNIHVGAIVFVKQTPWEELTVGDVVTYKLTDSTGKEVAGFTGFPYTFPAGSTDTYTLTYSTTLDARDVIDMWEVDGFSIAEFKSFTFIAG